MKTQEHNSNRFLKKLSWVWLVAGVTLGAYLVYLSGVLAPSSSATASVATANANVANASFKVAEKPISATRNIEDIRVGDRVLAHNPQVPDSERASWSEPDWREWIHLSLVMPKEDGSELKIELLRPESWALSRIQFVVDQKPPADEVPLVDTTIGADQDTIRSESPASSLPYYALRPIFQEVAFTAAILDSAELELAGLMVELDLPEMGATGPAVIADIHPCPPIESGEGQPVTATFSHPPSTQVLDVVFEGDSHPIGVTDNHLFWSENRQDFLPIGKMEIGERVRTFRGETKRIEQQLPRPGPEVVYNLEIYGEHVYFVGQGGILVHNNYLDELAARTRSGGRTVIVGDGPFSFGRDVVESLNLRRGSVIVSNLDSQVDVAKRASLLAERAPHEAFLRSRGIETYTDLDATRLAADARIGDIDNLIWNGPVRNLPGSTLEMQQADMRNLLTGFFLSSRAKLNPGGRIFVSQSASFRSVAPIADIGRGTGFNVILDGFDFRTDIFPNYHLFNSLGSRGTGRNSTLWIFEKSAQW